MTRHGGVERPNWADRGIEPNLARSFDRRIPANAWMELVTHDNGVAGDDVHVLLHVLACDDRLVIEGRPPEGEFSA